MALTYTLEDHAAPDEGCLGSRVARAGGGHAGARIAANPRPSPHLIARGRGRKTERELAPMPTTINYADV